MPQENLSRRSFLKGFGFGATLALATATQAHLTTDAIEQVELTLPLPRWDLEGFRLVLLSDLHVNLWTAVQRAQRACDMALAAEPDLIVVTGDFATTSKGWALEHIRQAVEPLRQAKCPCLAVLGNHDYTTDRPQDIIATVRSSPLRLLRNEMLEIAGARICGIDDALAGRHRPELLPTTGLDKNVITLLHEPDYVEEMPIHSSLQLSGHSHGGQICLPFGIPLHTPRGARRYTGGFYPTARSPLYVNRGIGTIGPDLRLFCRPEVSILTLRSAS